ncbi:MAG: methionine adenosyltransferase domain-containing protein [Thermoguttaceae bacterium]|nr:methionine adenosyltransferase domain-containing protein [Thermoguttaceae bacterium]
MAFNSETCVARRLAYAIGVADPVSVLLDFNGTGKVCQTKVEKAVRDLFALTPTGIIKSLDLRRPIYEKTSFGGHFGRNDADFTWERLDKVAELAKLLD